MALQTGQSHSWWFASKDRLQNLTTTQSPWLSLTLSDLEERIKQMLNLVEDDADSFAERAEMYYKKRPQLVNMIEDFYRTHRSLAEQYDILRSVLAARRPISVISSYFDKSWPQSPSNNEPDEERKSSSDPFDYEGSEIDDPDQEETEVESKLREMTDEGTVSYFVKQKDELVVKLEDELEGLKDENAKLKAEIAGKNEGTTSYLMKQKDEPVVELKNELEGLKEENAKRKAETEGKKEEKEIENKVREMSVEGTSSFLMKQKDELIVKLKDELEELKVGNTILKAEIVAKNEEIVTENKMREISDEGPASNLIKQKDELMVKLKDELEGLKEETEKLKAEIAAKSEETEVANKMREIYLVKQKDELVDKLKDELEEVKEENAKLKAEIAEKNEGIEVENKLREKLLVKLKDELKGLNEVNAKLKADIVAKNEEKREVIRQLAFSLEILKEENFALRRCIKEPEKNNCVFDLKELPGRLFAGISSKFQSTVVAI